MRETNPHIFFLDKHFPPTITAGYTLGHVDYSNSEEGRQNRVVFKKEIFASATMFMPKQIHSDRIHIYPQWKTPEREFTIEADAVITDKEDVIIGVLTADCLPVVLSDVRGRIIGAVHIGWRGLEKKILTKVIRRINARFNIASSQLLLAFFPSIRGCCYHVPRDFQGFFPELVKRGNKYYLDIADSCLKEALNNGIIKGNIHFSHECTYDSSFLHSARRDGNDCGRMLNFIAKKKSKIINKGFL